MSDALPATGARLQLAVTAANIGLFDWDLRTNTVWYSPEWKRQLGYADHEVSNAFSEWESRVHPDDLPSAMAKVRAYLEAPWPDFRLEARLRHRDGTYRWILGLIAMERDADGTPARVLGSHVDITERKHAELAVTQLLHFDQGILDSLSAHICVLDHAGVILAVNRAWVEFSNAGGAPAERTGIGANYLDVCTRAGGDDQLVAVSVREGVRAVIDGVRQEFAAEYECSWPNGTLWFELRASRFGGSGAARAVVSHLDITRIKVAEAALRPSESRLASAQALARVGSWHRVRNLAENSATEWSAEMFRLLHVPPSAGAPTFAQLLELFHPDDRQLVIDQLDAAAAGRSTTIELRTNPASGHDHVFSGSVNPLRNDAGDIVAFEGTLHDITERHRAATLQAHLREQLADAQRLEAVGRLAGGIAHDFNNMLSVVVGYAELGLASAPPDDPAHTCFQEILTAARRSADLTAQLLAFARRQVVQPRAVDLNELVAGLLGLLGRLIGEGIDLVWTPAAHVWPVFIDPSQVDRVLANLAANARDAMHGKGRLEISTANVEVGTDAAWPGLAAGQYVELAVRDNGEGMDAEVQAHVFEPFFTTKTGGRGTGLGLATVFGIVAQNGGAIRVESAPGDGATFRMILPRHDGRSVSEPKAAPVPGLVPHGAETILLVEDQEQILRFATMALQRAGYHVLPASCPADALDVVSAFEGTIHLVVTDVIMPGMHGQDLVERLLTLRPGVRAIFMSGFTSDVMAQGGVIGSGVHFIQKPFRGTELCALVREVLDEAAE
ncbi:MAG: PAS domain-containing protein [Acidobacteria bacterium]|nr:PAS domain-containing protein [Acidobacteriota bacterium]